MSSEDEEDIRSFLSSALCRVKQENEEEKGNEKGKGKGKRKGKGKGKDHEKEKERKDEYDVMSKYDLSSSSESDRESDYPKFPIQLNESESEDNAKTSEKISVASKGPKSRKRQRVSVEDEAVWSDQEDHEPQV
jgi:hypothetical protein